MNVGLVLSGGGTRGIAHMGLLKVFDEIGLRPSIISGSSSGAIIGALYASGYTPDEILEIIKEIKLLKILRPALRKTGLLKMDVTESLYHQFITRNSFEELSIPLIVSATDLQLGETEYFSTGELIRPLMASSSVPVLFDPVRIADKYYVDGGLLSNFPVEILKDKCEKIIGFHCNPVDEKFEISGIKSMIERTFLLTINANAKIQMEFCDLVVEPPALKKHKVFSFNKADEIFEIGYKHGKDIEDQLRSFCST